MRIINNTPKFAEGGVPTPSYVSFKPIGDAAPQEPATVKADDKPKASSKDADNDGIDDGMLKELYSSGLPSDVNQFLSLYNKFKYIKDNELSTPNNLNKMYLQVVGSLNKIKFEQKQYEEALKEATAANGLREIAVSDAGSVTVRHSDGSLESKHVSQIKPTDYILTNSDLLDIRAYDTDYALNSKVFTTVRNATSTKQILDELISRINTIGSTTQKASRFVRNDGKPVPYTGQDKDNIMALVQDAGQGIYGISSTVTSQEQQAKAAISFLINTLEPTYKNFLTAKAKQSGTTVTGLITQMVYSRLSGESDVIVNYDKELSKKEFGVAAVENKDDKMDPASMLLNGKGELTPISINIGGNLKYTAKAITGPITINNRAIGPTVGTELLKSQISGLLDSNNITLGDEHMIPSMLGQVLQEGNYARMDMPYTTDQHGNIKPDLQVFKILSANQMGMDKANMSWSERNSYLRSKGLNHDLYVSDGTFDPRYVKTFVGVNVYASEKAFKDDPSFQGLEEVNDSNVKDNFNTVVNKGKGSGSIYKGIMYIPLKMNVFDASKASGNLLSEPHMSGTEKDITTQTNIREFENRKTLGYKNTLSKSDL